ncbi:interaptin [Tieghemostelium lacteum]|uniref:Interaptin n=1 Tax=Tieghemostelium lacteum TaxID=361077 RepID=A0A151ZJB6_TIELA|nr:interaptin [Tieghemostelium lacteum]|eukprot:KYQ94005.1 interaptin [Tieghemostelium lacteum]
MPVRVKYNKEDKKEILGKSIRYHPFISNYNIKVDEYLKDQMKSKSLFSKQLKELSANINNIKKNKESKRNEICKEIHCSGIEFAISSIEISLLVKQLRFQIDQLQNDLLDSLTKEKICLISINNMRDHLTENEVELDYLRQIILKKNCQLVKFQYDECKKVKVNDYTRYKKLILQLEEKIVKSKKELETMTNLYCQSKSENKQIQKLKLQLEHTISNLDNQIIVLNSQVKGISKLENHIKELDNKLRIKEQQNSQLQLKCKGYEDITAQVCEYSKEMESLKKENQYLYMECQETQELVDHNNEIYQLNRDLLDKLFQLSEDLRYCNLSISQRDLVISQLLVQLNELNDRNNISTQKLQQLTSHCQLLLNVNSSLNNCISNMELQFKDNDLSVIPNNIINPNIQNSCSILNQQEELLNSTNMKIIELEMSNHSIENQYKKLLNYNKESNETISYILDSLNQQNNEISDILQKSVTLINHNNNQETIIYNYQQYFYFHNYLFITFTIFLMFLIILIN